MATVSENDWRRASGCSSNECIEVARHPSGFILIRNSAPGGVAWNTQSEWAAFVAGVKRGEFDLEALSSPE